MTNDIHRIAEGLSEQTVRDLTLHWDEACDADPLSHGRELDEYWADMEASDYAELVPVDEAALNDPFAYERGIEPGGMMWRFLPLGLALRQYLMEGR